MFNSKYSKTLTVILIIALIAIVSLLGFLGYRIYKKVKTDREAMQAISDFDEMTNENNEVVEYEGNIIDNIVQSSTTNTNSGIRTKKTYNNFVMLGYIEIPKTNVKYPILEKETNKSLEMAVAVRYPTNNIVLNQPGNIVIAGHNYRNNSFFSNNKKLSVGDLIYITDETGSKVSYTIYEIFSATPEDTSFYTRDTAGKAEITLTTCSDDGNSRLIVNARAN